VNSFDNAVSSAAAAALHDNSLHYPFRISPHSACGSLTMNHNNKSYQTFRTWFWHQKSMLIPKKVVQTFFDPGFFFKRVFMEKKCCFFMKIALWLKMGIFVQFLTKNSTFSFTKKRYLKKHQKMFGPLLKGCSHANV
jgi:hypothetical protein